MKHFKNIQAITLLLKTLILFVFISITYIGFSYAWCIFCPKSDFNNLYRAAKTIEGSLSVGVNIRQFTQYLQQYLAIGRRLVNNKFTGKMCYPCSMILFEF